MIKITLSKSSYWPGEEVVAEVFVSLGKPAKARGLYGIFECTEKRHVKTVQHLDHYDYERQKELGIRPYTNISVSHRQEEEKIFSREFTIAGEREYGRETFTVKFLLPRDAAPTSHIFGHDRKIHVWKLKVKLDIPMRLDENSEAEIFVEGLGKSV